MQAADATKFKRLIQWVWMGWEQCFEKFGRARALYSGEYGICKMFVTKYRGPSIPCQDGTWIQSGDWIGELHLNNRLILDMLRNHDANQVALRVARLTRGSMRQICAELQTHPQLGQVKALQGITLLHRGITHGLGFETYPLKQGTFRTLTTSYLRLLLTVFHPQNGGRIGPHTEKLVPLRLVMSRKALVQRFSIA
ncbi:polysaccharide deacetylase [Paenibacillus sp. M1]|uniref:Polysaccharide deacetylase n=1 Tax=Paenibacillus haidiansis TaxID=1574488 RepID=A0ABU7VSJ1_9BACL